MLLHLQALIALKLLTRENWRINRLKEKVMEVQECVKNAS